MPPHSLLRACSKCTTLLCSEPCHLTVSSSLFGWCALRHSEPCHLTVSYEPVRLVYDSAVFRAMPPHSLLRACSAGVPCGIQSHAISQSLRACSAGVPCGIQSHATSQSLRACSVRRIRRIAQYKKCLVHASMTSHFLYCAAWL